MAPLVASPSPSPWEARGPRQPSDRYCGPLGQMENRQGEASAALGLESGTARTEPSLLPRPRVSVPPSYRLLCSAGAAPAEGRGQGMGPRGLSRYLK